MPATDRQVGGDHYRRFKIQPVEFIRENGLSYLQGNIIKYVVRAGTKEGSSSVQDLLKAQHYLEMLIEDVGAEGVIAGFRRDSLEGVLGEP